MSLHGKKIPRLSTEFRDLGFGNNVNTSHHQRLMNRDGSSNVVREGLPWIRPMDAYNSLITMSWMKFHLIIIVSYTVINAFFAGIYVLIGPEHLRGIGPNDDMNHFLSAFFFSAQTISTVGYGHISPHGVATSTVAAIESMLGLLGFALATGLLYGRFSKPTAKILYSDFALIAPYKGGISFQFRLVNLKKNQLIENEIEVIFSCNEADSSGKIQRHFYPLKLERKQVSLLALSWTVVHPINEDSPVFNQSKADLEKCDAEIMVFLKAFDDTFSQTVHSRTSYKYFEIVWGGTFKPIFGPNEQGITTINISKVHDHEKVVL